LTKFKNWLDPSSSFEGLTRRQKVTGSITFGIWVILALAWFLGAAPFYLALLWIPVHLIAYRVIK